MNKETFLKIELLLNQASSILRECSIESYLSGEIQLMLKLNPIRFQLSDLIQEITIDQLSRLSPTDADNQEPNI